ncbi:MAG: TonB-dependent receptor [Sphingomonas sp.]|uniref:TonB-dependent receptor n=1 Tax=Sphingomonas sp. TaxID=28214 RepID=UPI0025FC235A|nr:TonB-dependent receptor [Sphingomonas sp.]MBX3563580.1 TonB-dependent receptor [Sphingomonas sp.]
MKSAFLACSMLAISAAASPAFAQQADNTTGDDEIVVTATRNETLLSKTPIAMTAISTEQLRDQGITDPTRLVEAAPNLQIDRVMGQGVQITIRGVSSADNSQKGDPSAAFLNDGIYIARQQAVEVSLFDLERVEVLRGPQGTLYGRNTTAGVVNVISARPTNKFSVSGDFAYGNFDTIQATGVVNVPLGDNFAVRAAVNFNRRDNYVLRFPGSPGLRVNSPAVLPRPVGPSLDPGKDDLSFRLGAKLDIGERIRLYLKGDYSEIKGSNTTGVAVSNFYQMPIAGPAAGQRGATPVYLTDRTDTQHRTLNYPQINRPLNDNRTWGIHGELEVDLADNVTATYLGSYREFRRDEVQGMLVGVSYPGPPGPPPNIVFPLDATYKGDYYQQSHELRLAYNSDLLTAQAGAYYFRESSVTEFLLFGTRFFQPGQRGYIYGFPTPSTISKTLGFFGQATLNVGDNLRFTAGIRHTTDDKSRLGYVINHVKLTDPLDFTTGTQPGTTNPGSAATGGQPVRDSLNNASVNYSKVTWKLGVDFDLTPSTLLYATVSTGYKAGGFNDGCLAGQANCATPAPASALFYKPETLTSYEAGVKANLLDRKLRVTAAAFHYDYSNLQLSQINATYCGGPCLVISNAAKAKIDGVEFEAIANPSPRNRFNFAINWLDARYTDYLLTPGVNFAGEKLDRSPEWTAMAGYQYTLPVGDGSLVLGARTRMSDRYQMISTSLRNFFRQPAFTKTDLTLTYNAPGDMFYIQGYLKNLENVLTVGSVSLSANFPSFTDGNLQFGDPRTYGVRAGFRF